ncbi:putative ArsR family transcriptional regulator [Salirhabdus euzebyi]|uniref:Putative ArsR family transcriptional regulator n=1 Tax=Salirhabdus euzebyi TaxID=394506 RepID=A0A841PZA2_9BACI|nr:winged helix-turn-helix domain-containing protein [Salirhabdus euzebyi]MBB6452651.1 putative ArsR family transcriptional regulator [Salirhabdus euzebyi]
MSNVVKITAQQQKLITSAIRIQILHTLIDKPMTAKQVAEKLGKSNGSIHYHMQLLYEGDLLKLVDTKNIRGTTEKYFLAIGTNFTSENETDHIPEIHISSNLQLSLAERREFLDDLKQLLLKWEKKTAKQADDDSASYFIRTKIEEE